MGLQAQALRTRLHLLIWLGNQYVPTVEVDLLPVQTPPIWGNARHQHPSHITEVGVVPLKTCIENVGQPLCHVRYGKVATLRPIRCLVLVTPPTAGEPDSLANLGSTSAQVHLLLVLPITQGSLASVQTYLESDTTSSCSSATQLAP